MNRLVALVALFVALLAGTPYAVRADSDSQPPLQEPGEPNASWITKYKAWCRSKGGAPSCKIDARNHPDCTCVGMMSATCAYDDHGTPRQIDAHTARRSASGYFVAESAAPLCGQ